MGEVRAFISRDYIASWGAGERVSSSWHKAVKREDIHPLTTLCLEDARHIVADFMHEYNNGRLHSGIGYVMRQA